MRRGFKSHRGRHIMSRFKKLKTVEIIDDEELEGMEETDVFFNKAGWYLDRYYGVSWYEIKTSTGIRAFKSNVDHFNWSLKTVMHNPLTQEEVDAVRIAMRVCNSKKLRELYDIDWHWKDLRNIGRETRLWLQRVLKEIEKANENSSS